METVYLRTCNEWGEYFLGTTTVLQLTGLLTGTLYFGLRLHCPSYSGGATELSLSRKLVLIRTGGMGKNRAVSLLGSTVILALLGKGEPTGV